MSKHEALRLIKRYNRKRAFDSNVKAIVTYAAPDGYEAALMETESGAIVGRLLESGKQSGGIG